jgi:hypothetical protein
MSIANEINEEPLDICDPQIRAVVHRAQCLVDATATVLNVLGPFFILPSEISEEFLMESAAVFQLGVWEQKGIQVYLDTELPTYQEAREELEARVRKGLAEFEGPDASPLFRQMLKTWWERFAWDADDLFQSQIMLGDVAEDQFATVMADFIFQHRHELKNILKLSKNP